MKNKLENFVSRHREAFDAEMPENDLWSGIDTAPAAKTGIFRRFTRMQVAAAVLLLINAAIIIFLLERRPGHEPSAGPQTVQETPAQADEHTLEQISRVVEIKQARLKEIEHANPVLYHKFISALDELNKNYKELEKQLELNINKDQLLEAMIQNLSLQQELLNRQLSIYQKIKQHKNEKIS